MSPTEATISPPRLAFPDCVLMYDGVAVQHGTALRRCTTLRCCTTAQHNNPLCRLLQLIVFHCRLRTAAPRFYFVEAALTGEGGEANFHLPLYSLPADSLQVNV